MVLFTSTSQSLVGCVDVSWVLRVFFVQPFRLDVLPPLRFRSHSEVAVRSVTRCPKIMSRADRTFWSRSHSPTPPKTRRPVGNFVPRRTSRRPTSGPSPPICIRRGWSRERTFRTRRRGQGGQTSRRREETVDRGCAEAGCEAEKVSQAA